MSSTTSTTAPETAPKTDAAETPARKAMPELDAAKAAKTPAKKSPAKKTAAKPAAKKAAAKKPAAKKPAAKKETTTTATATPTPAASDFEWPRKPLDILIDYLKANISTERDAPNKGLPFITENGVLRIRAEHWRGYLAEQGIEPSKLESARPIRELGFAMKPYALPGESRSHGFYTGPAPKAAEKLPRRILERATSTGGARKTKGGPFGRFDAETLGLLSSAVNNYPKRQGGELRVKLLAELEQASKALAEAAAETDAENAAAAPSSPSSDGPSAEEIAAAAAVAK